MTTTPLRALTAGLIDYAGLFPPATLAMAEAVRNYDSYIHGEHAWMLGRLIVPAARLAEYTEAARSSGVDARGWRLSVLAMAADAAAIRSFGEAHADCGVIDTLEIKAAHQREITDSAAAFEGAYQLYFETPAATWRSLLPAIGKAQGRAKLRTGGPTADDIPAETRVLEFLRLASERRVAFKATAGLHHPLRSTHPLTYKDNSPRAAMHGFLNVFCAAALLWQDADLRQEASWMLAERDADAITIDEMTMTWHNSGVSLTTAEIERARAEFAFSFGSCSFTEPVDDLRALGWL